MNALQSHLLVREAGISNHASRVLVLQCVQSHVSERAEAVVKGHNNDVVVLREIRTIVELPVLLDAPFPAIQPPRCTVRGLVLLHRRADYAPARQRTR